MTGVKNWWKETNAWATIWDNTVCDLIVGCNHHTCIIQNPLNSLYYKYNAISAVNPQSILVSFSINMGVFSGHRFLSWVAFSLPQGNVTYYMWHRHSVCLYVYLQPLLVPTALKLSGFRYMYQANHLCLCYYYYT